MWPLSYNYLYLQRNIDKLLFSPYDIVTKEYSNFYCFVSISVSMIQMACFFHHCLFKKSCDRSEGTHLRFEGTNLIK